MTHQVYIIIHLIGAFFVVFSLGGNLVQAINGGVKKHSFAKILGITHGVGLLLLFFAGFGLIAKLNYVPIPIWVWIKILIWGFYAVVSSLAFNRQKLSILLWVITLVLFICIIILAKIKPF